MCLNWILRHTVSSKEKTRFEDAVWKIKCWQHQPCLFFTTHLAVTKVFPQSPTHNLNFLFQRCALIGMVPQLNQPATCLLRKTTGSICSAAGCWVEMFFVFCELWLIVDGALFFTVAVLVEGGGIGLRPAALAKNALFVSHVGSWEKRMAVTNIILSFRQCSPLTWK